MFQTKRWIWLLALVGLVWVGVGCMSPQDETLQPLPYRSVPESDQWTVGDQPAYLVVTEKSWPRNYAQPPQGADFSANVYVVASLGVKPNPGYTVRIAQMKRRGGRVTVMVEMGEPDPQRFYAQVLVQPVAVAAVSRKALGAGDALDFVFVDLAGKQLAALRVEL